MNKAVLTIQEAPDGMWSLCAAGQKADVPLYTPRKQPFALPSRALAEALAKEWRGRKAFSARLMPLTAIAFAAIDVVQSHRAQMEGALLAYAETDLLCYRSETPALRGRQQERWDPVLAWVRQQFNCGISCTDGVMPVVQPAETLECFRAELQGMDAFQMAAFTVLTQNLGSLLLAFAVRGAHMEAAEAFHCSRVDEDYQAEQWGEDSVSVARAREIERDVLAAERFLLFLSR